MKLQNVIHILVGILCIGLFPNAQALSPPPDGGYPNFTTAEGTNALQNLTTGAGNTGVGWRALFSAGDANFNTGVGVGALLLNTGDSNTAVGTAALLLNTTGSGNVCVGQAAGNGITTHNNIIAIGQGVSGVSGFFGEVDNACYIGNIWQHGVNPNNGYAVLVDADGKLGTALDIPRGASSAQFNIKPMANDSESILALKPATFRHKQEFDATGIPAFGLVAEEVAKVNPALVVLDREGKPVTVRYEQVNAMLLNEFLKEHKKVEAQQATIAALKNEVQTVVAQLKEQAAEIQKVSAQIEMSKPAPQAVLNNQ